MKSLTPTSMLHILFSYLPLAVPINKNAYSNFSLPKDDRNLVFINFNALYVRAQLAKRAKKV